MWAIHLPLFYCFVVIQWQSLFRSWYFAFCFVPVLPQCPLNYYTVVAAAVTLCCFNAPTAFSLSMTEELRLFYLYSSLAMVSFSPFPYYSFFLFTPRSEQRDNCKSYRHVNIELKIHYEYKYLLVILLYLKTICLYS